MFGRKKTPDQELVADIKRVTSELQSLGLEAKRRGITVWLKHRNWGKVEVVKPDTLHFDEAYKTERNNL